MKKYFAQLRPMERRLAVGVLVVLIIVLNWIFIWPHFSDWGNLRQRGDDARQKLKLFQSVIAQTGSFQAELKKFENQGEFVAPEDQSITMMRAIQSQSLESGVFIANTSPQMTHTNEFFTEQILNITITATDSQLVDFLYKLGNDASMVRVIDLELQPDGPKMKLTGQIRLVASYQKNPKAATADNLKSTTAKAK
jgi:Tfp pilus assembly protein PilO